MLDLTQVDLGRLRGKDASSLARWLAGPDALDAFQTAIAEQLKRIRLATSHDVEGVYTFGREMRNIFDNRAGRDLQFTVNLERIPPKALLVFMLGFLRQPYEDAEQIFEQPKEKVQQLLDVIFSSRHEKQF